MVTRYASNDVASDVGGDISELKSIFWCYVVNGNLIDINARALWSSQCKIDDIEFIGASCVSE